jgi:hypothetical protein
MEMEQQQQPLEQKAEQRRLPRSILSPLLLAVAWQQLSEMPKQKQQLRMLLLLQQLVQQRQTLLLLLPLLLALTMALVVTAGLLLLLVMKLLLLLLVKATQTWQMQRHVLSTSRTACECWVVGSFVVGYFGHKQFWRCCVAV